MVYCGRHEDLVLRARIQGPSLSLRECVGQLWWLVDRLLDSPVWFMCLLRAQPILDPPVCPEPTGIDC